MTDWESLTNRSPASAESEDPRTWELRLYVAGTTANSLRAIDNLKRICETHLKGRYTVEVVDVRSQHGLLRPDQVIAIPTLVRRPPPSIMQIVGDLSDTERVLVGLGLRPGE